MFKVRLGLLLKGLVYTFRNLWHLMFLEQPLASHVPGAILLEGTAKQCTGSNPWVPAIYVVPKQKCSWLLILLPGSCCFLISCSVLSLASLPLLRSYLLNGKFGVKLPRSWSVVLPKQVFAFPYPNPPVQPPTQLNFQLPVLCLWFSCFITVSLLNTHDFRAFVSTYHLTEDSHKMAYSCPICFS